MFSSVFIVAFLPWLDTSNVKSAAYRPLFRIFFWLFAACAVLLGYMGSKPPEGGYVIAARFLTVYYFLYFLVILPLLGFYEKPKPLPPSICDAVLGKSGRAVAADTNSMQAREPGQ